MRRVATLALASVLLMLGLSSVAQGAVTLTWSSPGRVGTVRGSTLIDLSCPSASLCVGFDDVGDIVTTRYPARGPKRWSVARLNRRAGSTEGQILGISCPSASLCVAYDSAGHVITSKRPAASASAWRVTGVDRGNAIDGLSCPSASLCVAVDGAGNAITSTDPTGGSSAWTVSFLGDHSSTYECVHYQDASCQTTTVSAVSCPTVSLCGALDQAGNVIATSDPTGGPLRWRVVFTEAPDADSGVNHFSCVSALFCAGSDGWGDFVASGDPTGGQARWNVTGVGAGDLPVTSLPNAGFSDIVTSVACPSASLCVASNGNGDTIATRDPTATAPSWNVVLKHTRMVACGSAAWCFAWDTRGHLFSSRTPAAGTGAWHESNPDGARSPTMFSCPTVSLCLMLDDRGRLLLGRPTPGRATIRNALTGDLAAVAKGATIAALRARPGYAISFAAPAAGSVAFNCYLASRAHRRSPVRIVAARATFVNTANSRILLKLTAAGRSLLRAATRLTLTAKVTFTPTTMSPITVGRTITLR